MSNRSTPTTGSSSFVQSFLRLYQTLEIIIVYFYFHRLLDHDKATPITGKRFQVSLVSLELQMIKQTICPILYKQYMSKLLTSNVNFFFNRFECYTISMPNVSNTSHVLYRTCAINSSSLIVAALKICIIIGRIPT